MATEKQLLSRIQLRYDSYANWTSTTLGDGKGAKLVLKAGEVGICTIPAGTTADGIQNPPHVMFKVGDGTSTFAALPWTSAKAADVHAWAKQASLPVSSEGSGNAVTSIAWDAATNGIKFTKGETFATAAELAAVEKKVTDLDGTYATDVELAAAVKTINEAIATKLSNADFEEFKTANTKAISDAKDAAISAAAADAKTKADNALAAAEGKVTALANGAVKANTEAIAEMKDGENGFLAQAAADAKSKADKALEDAKAYADQAETDAVSSAKGYTDGEIDKVEAALGKVVDGTTPVAEATHAANADKAADADKLGGTAAADYALKTYVDTAEKDAVDAAKAYTDEVKKAILTGESTTELKAAYDTLVEIQEWIEGPGVNATELTEAIAAEAKARG